MLVGEQPGDAEDRTGRPFVGPAGRLLDRAMAEAGLDRGSVYLTNAVKHFKWTRKGKRRIHKQPAKDEVLACGRWLRAEIETLRPRAILCLGATAATALLGSDFRVTRERGKLVPSDAAELVMATVHPASILRGPDEEARQRAYRAFVADLRKIADALRSLPGPSSHHTHGEPSSWANRFRDPSVGEHLRSHSARR
jgi:uracil-DNA glycosylase